MFQVILFPCEKEVHVSGHFGSVSDCQMEVQFSGHLGFFYEREVHVSSNFGSMSEGSAVFRSSRFHLREKCMSRVILAPCDCD